ncbi:MAG TPA: type II toxin-antitoxin system RelE/ParE family toxin [Candidatus Kapabacteria bacterium]
MRVIWTQPAVDSLIAIREYIAQNNPLNAERFVSSLINFTDLQLETFPYSGRKIPELSNANYRELLFKSYRVMYSIDNDAIHVLSLQNSCQQFRPFT